MPANLPSYENQELIKEAVDAVKTTTDATKTKVDTIDTRTILMDTTLNVSKGIQQDIQTKVTNIQTKVNAGLSAVKSVQRGTGSGNESVNTKVIPIATVNPAKCSVTVLGSPNSGSYPVIAFSLNANSLTIGKAVNDQAIWQNSHLYSWEVVEFY